MQRPERYLFLFNNSRTCSIVSGVSRALNAFWLLPCPRNGRLPAKGAADILRPPSGATRVPSAADATPTVSVFVNSDLVAIFAVVSPVRKRRVANCRDEKARSAENDFAGDLSRVQKFLAGSFLAMRVPAAPNCLPCAEFTSDMFGLRMRSTSLASCSWARVAATLAVRIADIIIIRTSLNVPK